MKLIQATVFAAVTMLCVGTTFGEVAIKEAQLKWEDVANLDGDVVFDNLCAVCHGVGGKGNGPAVSALEHTVPDLTIIAASKGAPLEVNFRRDGVNQNVTVTPELKTTKNIFGEEIPRYVIGITAAGEVFSKKLNPLNARRMQ